MSRKRFSLFGVIDPSPRSELSLAYNLINPLIFLYHPILRGTNESRIRLYACIFQYNGIAVIRTSQIQYGRIAPHHCFLERMLEVDGMTNWQDDNGLNLAIRPPFYFSNGRNVDQPFP